MISDLGYIIVRTSLFPYYKFNKRKELIYFLDELKDWTDIYNITNSKIFMEALYLSSRSLYKEIIQLQKIKSISPFYEFTYDDHKILTKILKYYIRMSTRSTPFGICAGISVLELTKEKTNLRLNKNTFFKKNIRLDFEFIFSFIENILKNTDHHKYLQFFSNNTNWKESEDLCFIKTKNNNYSKIKVENSFILEEVLTFTHSPKSFNKIKEFIAKRVDLEETIIESYLEELIKSEILLPNVYPDLFSKNPTSDFFNKIKNIPNINSVLECKSDIEHLNKQKVGLDTEQYEIIINRLTNRQAHYENKNILHTDLYTSFKRNKINQNIVNNITNVIEFLTKKKGYSGNQRLIEFSNKMEERYGTNKEVPLLEVLDTVHGIGYPANGRSTINLNKLLSGLDQLSNVNSKIEVDDWDALLMAKYLNHVNSGEYNKPLEFTDTDIPIEKESVNLPSSLYASFSIFCKNNEDIDTGNYIIEYAYTGGPSSINLLSRFANLDSSLKTKLKESVTSEEIDSDEIYAEILHLPNNKAANVLQRSDIRKYNIPILAFSSQGKSIYLNDIMVKTINGKIILRSKKLNKIIKPRLTSAHNYSNTNLGIYYFLCDLNFQDSVSGAYWSWGTMLNGLPYKPRVMYKNIILSRECWEVKKEQFKDSHFKNKESWIEIIKSYIRNNKIPQSVRIRYGSDQMLILDLERDICLFILQEELSRNGIIMIEENLINEKSLFLSNDNGNFVNEFILPLQNLQQKELVTNFISNVSEVPDVFTPGDQWLYLNIFSNFELHDIIITKIGNELIFNPELNEIYSEYFFIKYNNPQPHIRFRFKLLDNNYMSLIVGRINNVLNEFIKNKSIWSIQIDTYRRELDRYKHLKYEKVESIFHKDSISTMKILEELNLNKMIDSPELRTTISMISCQTYLDSAGFSFEEQIDFCNRISSAFSIEFNTKKFPSSIKRLNENYRNIQEDLLHWKNSIFYSKIGFILAQRSNELKVEFEEIQNLSLWNKIPLMESLLHMSFNRLFINDHRLNEFALYHFMPKFLKMCRYAYKNSKN